MRSDVLMAMERGEVQACCGGSYSSRLATRASWIADKTINTLLRRGLDKHPDVPPCLRRRGSKPRRRHLPHPAGVARKAGAVLQ